MLRATAVILSSLLYLSACGQTTGDRALSGGGIGAAGGAAAGALVGAPVTGALIGAAAGAAAGAGTTSSQVNFGQPIWH